MQRLGNSHELLLTLRILERHFAVLLRRAIFKSRILDRRGFLEERVKDWRGFRRIQSLLRLANHVTKRQRLATLHQGNFVGISLLFRDLADAAHELGDPLAAATVLVQHAQDFAHLGRVLMLCEHRLLVEIPLHALADVMQMIVPLHGIGDRLADLVAMRRAACHLLVGSGDVRRGDRQPVRDVSRIIIRTLRHARKQMVVAIRLLEQCTLDALDAVRIDLPLGIRVGVDVVLPRDMVEDSGNEAAIRRCREVAALVFLVSGQVLQRDLLRILLRLLTRAQTRAARRRSRDRLDLLFRESCRDLADEHGRTHLRHGFRLEAKLLRMFLQECTIARARRTPERVAQESARDGDRPAVAIQDDSIGTHDRRTKVRAATFGEVFRAKTRRHLHDLLLHVGAFTVARLQRLRIGGILQESLRVVRCH